MYGYWKMAKQESRGRQVRAGAIRYSVIIRSIIYKDYYRRADLEKSLPEELVNKIRISLLTHKELHATETTAR